jgi:phosphonate transport system ATP-binding protein
VTPSNQPVVEAKGLQIDAGGNPVVKNVNLSVSSGERVALVGHNGAGKSTLLRAMTGFCFPARGSLKVLGTEVGTVRGSHDLRGLRSQVAMVHQGLHLVGRLTALDNVLIGGAARDHSRRSWLRGWPDGERGAAQRALERVGMAWARSRRTDTLSGGERQKIAVARALHQRAPLLLADEPTASLDADATAEIIGLLASVAAELESTLVCIVHDLDLLPRLADRAVVLRQGAIVADVPVTPQTPGQLRGLLK